MMSSEKWSMVSETNHPSVRSSFLLFWAPTRHESCGSESIMRSTIDRLLGKMVMEIKKCRHGQAGAGRVTTLR